jgi:hypothetical protein
LPFIPIYSDTRRFLERTVLENERPEFYFLELPWRRREIFWIVDRRIFRNRRIKFLEIKLKPASNKFLTAFIWYNRT